MISSCNKIQLDDLPCHFKNGMEQSAIYRCASKVIYSFAQRVLRSQWVHYTVFSWRSKYTSMFHIQNWVAGCVFKYTFFFFFYFSVVSGSLFPHWNYLFSSPLLALCIALQFFPCSCNLSVMFHLFCFLLFLYLGIKLSRGEGRGLGGRRVESVPILAANFVMANKSGLTGN